jgi:hypothetical protein
MPHRARDARPRRHTLFVDFQIISTLFCHISKYWILNSGFRDLTELIISHNFRDDRIGCPNPAFIDILRKAHCQIPHLFRFGRLSLQQKRAQVPSPLFRANPVSNHRLVIVTPFFRAAGIYSSDLYIC